MMAIVVPSLGGKGASTGSTYENKIFAQNY